MNRAIVLFQPYEDNSDDDSVFFDDTLDTSFLLIENVTHECALCMASKQILVRKENPRLVIGLEDAPFVGQSDCLFLGPCNRHIFCVSCLARVLTDYENHPINDQHPLVTCLSPFETCQNDDGNPYYFSHHQVAKILDNTAFNQYIDRADRFAFPGFQMIKCAVCHSGILVEAESIQTARRGELIIACDQTRFCARRVCYYCEKSVGLANDCQRCLQSSEHEDPDAFNHYFYKIQTGDSYEKSDFFYRNGELTVPLIVERLVDLCKYDEPPVKCFGCNVLMKKTEACNTLEHCEFEICYACGRCSFRNASLGDHWSEHGHSGCPRFDIAPYWNESARCEYVCPFFACTSHFRGDCKIESHQPGIKKYHDTRKQAMVYHALKSLLPETREQVFDDIKQNHPHVPLPDPTIFEILERHVPWRSHYSEVIVRAFLATS